MQGNDREQSHQDLWKSQEDVPMQMTTDEVRAKARRYERENVLVFWAMLGLTPLFLALFIYDVVRLHEPVLVQVGGGLAVATFCCIAGRLVWKGPNRIVSGEPCVHFLRREFEGKRQGLLWARRCWLLLIPAMLASFLLGNATAQTTVSFPTEDGGIVYADVYGKGDKGIVLAHGGQFNKASWERQARTLVTAKFRVLALDFRGYGKSRGPGDSDPMDAPLHLDVLAAVPPCWRGLVRRSQQARPSRRATPWRQSLR